MPRQLGRGSLARLHQAGLQHKERAATLTMCHVMARLFCDGAPGPLLLLLLSPHKVEQSVFVKEKKEQQGKCQQHCQETPGGVAPDQGWCSWLPVFSVQREESGLATSEPAAGSDRMKVFVRIMASEAKQPNQEPSAAWLFWNSAYSNEHARNHNALQMQPIRLMIRWFLIVWTLLLFSFF